MFGISSKMTGLFNLACGRMPSSAIPSGCVFDKSSASRASFEASQDGTPSLEKLFSDRSSNTVDGRNPAPTGMCKTLQISGYFIYLPFNSCRISSINSIKHLMDLFKHKPRQWSWKLQSRQVFWQWWSKCCAPEKAAGNEHDFCTGSQATPPFKQRFPQKKSTKWHQIT